MCRWPSRISSSYREHCGPHPEPEHTERCKQLLFFTRMPLKCRISCISEAFRKHSDLRISFHFARSAKTLLNQNINILQFSLEDDRDIVEIHPCLAAERMLASDIASLRHCASQRFSQSNFKSHRVES